MGIDDIVSSSRNVKDINVISYELKDVDSDTLRDVCEKVEIKLQIA
ncbi:hypothetical protein [Clostridium beijerinckii]|nr:hypothetical protein [Clostridium beijerinckii]NRU19492.1 hypothetical protein [Clostridium beijerinckii]